MQPIQREENGKVEAKDGRYLTPLIPSQEVRISACLDPSGEEGGQCSFSAERMLRIAYEKYVRV